MTDLNNSNAGEEQPTPQSDNGAGNGDANDLDSAWAAFAEAHADDLKDVEHSRNAKRFEKHARRKEKEALLSVNDLDNGTFTDDLRPLGARIRGPRDNTASSWLDTDDVMNRYGDDFTPPNPEIGPVKMSKLVFWVLLVAGIVGVIASVFVPALAALLGTVFGACAIIGAAGLIIQHKGHTETRNGYTDDGARV
ncbi:hypothetical protein DSM100688_0271 [Bifidobacterium ramosum]|uniref:Membrane associated protein n=1 Tax=Bifidobacterium ramosum TaxID=1798158 RepID=A0A6L4X2G6_9BIFI|nr:hypothetical protein [Bifidobacterium ramosum]KAB8289191.1 hypothetical protein DSM100688_0271 [Bifidobacterium ramosum]NEG70900.1 hypothetical protein [Bifidobacterium ramosum]